MYTALKNTQIVIALLKKYGIKNIVISPGTRNGPFVHSVEEDPYFKCYSVVDERSAAFFALGIVKQLLEPVVVSCTSSTAACNYYSAVTEAYYSHIPLVLLTSDRHPYNRGQLEKQQIEQVDMYGKMCRKSVDLPLNIDNVEDFRYCERLVNEALLELDHREGGPVQINMPAYYDLSIFNEKELPKVRRIFRNELRAPYTEHERGLADKLRSCGKIMLFCGSCPPWSGELRDKLESFMARYNCALVAQHMSNIHEPRAIMATAGVDICNCFKNDTPELIITIGGPAQMMYLEQIKDADMEHWLVSMDGGVIDPTHCLTEIFECSIEHFFDYFNAAADESQKNDGAYEAKLRESLNEYFASRPELTRFSNIYAIREFCRLVPPKSMVSMSILNAIRIVETFPLADGVDVYANVGAYGIDGCMSTFLGQACVTDRPAYMVIGDLSFIYDMNSIWIRHVSDNVHILLINNHEGIEMRRSWRHHGDTRRHITAGHHASPRGWIEENGFEYFTASDKSELAAVMPEFINSNKKCVLEVFTNPDIDTEEAFAFYQDTSAGAGLKSAVKSVIGDEGVYKIKKFLGKR